MKENPLFDMDFDVIDDNLLNLEISDLDEVLLAEDPDTTPFKAAFNQKYFSAVNEEKKLGSIRHERTGITALDFNSFYEFALGKIPEIKIEERIAFDLDEFRYVLKKFYRGGEFESILNEPADASLFSERFIVFEIDAIKENRILFPIVTLIIMDVFIQKMRHRKDQRKALIIEEAWKAIASPLMAGYILYLYKTVRKFWGEAIVVTQELGDIIGNAVVKDSILNNSDTICLLDQSKFKENYKEIGKLLAITEIEQKKIFTINKLGNTDNRGALKRYISEGVLRGSVRRGGLYFSVFGLYYRKTGKKCGGNLYPHLRDLSKRIGSFCLRYGKSGLPLDAFIRQINKDGIPIPSSTEYFKPDFV